MQDVGVPGTGRSLVGVSLGTFLFGSFGALCLVLLGLSVFGLRDAVTALDRARRAVTVSEAAQSAFATLQAHRIERGPLRVALRAEAPADADILAGVERARGTAAPALDALLAACAAGADCGSPEAVQRLGAARDRLAQARRKADAEVRRPRAERPADAAESWNKAATEMINQLEATTAALTSGIRTGSAFGARMAQVKDAAYAARDAAGLERDDIARAMTEGRVPEAIRPRVAALRSQVAVTWPMVLAVAGSDAPPALRDAIRAAEEEYFTRFIALRGAIEAALEAGRAPPVSATAMSAALDSATGRLVAVAATAFEAARADAEGALAAARLQLALQAALAVLVLLLGAYTGRMIARRVLAPLRASATALGRLAERNYAFELPAGAAARRDEVGAIARAIEACRTGLQRADVLAAEQQAEHAAGAARAERVEGLVHRFEAEAAEALRAMAVASTELDATAREMQGTAQGGAEQAASLAAASEQASANVATVAASAEEMAASIGEVARQVAESARAARQAAGDARATDDAVGGLAEAAG
ncbi:HAMP domain-containing protein, partial [Roseicella aquatilis]